MTWLLFWAILTPQSAATNSIPFMDEKNCQTAAQIWRMQAAGLPTTSSVIAFCIPDARP